MVNHSNQGRKLAEAIVMVTEEMTGKSLGLPPTVLTVDALATVWLENKLQPTELMEHAFGAWQESLFIDQISSLSVSDLTKLVESSEPERIARIMRVLAGQRETTRDLARTSVAPMSPVVVTAPVIEDPAPVIEEQAPTPPAQPAPVARKQPEEVLADRVGPLREAREARRERLAREREARRAKRVLAKEKKQRDAKKPAEAAKKVQKKEDVALRKLVPKSGTRAEMAASRRELVAVWDVVDDDTKALFSEAVRAKDYPYFSSTDLSTLCKECGTEWPDETFICPATDSVYENCPSCRRAAEAYKKKKAAKAA